MSRAKGLWMPKASVAIKTLTYRGPAIQLCAAEVCRRLVGCLQPFFLNWIRRSFARASPHTLEWTFATSLKRKVLRRILIRNAPRSVKNCDGKTAVWRACILTTIDGANDLPIPTQGRIVLLSPHAGPSNNEAKSSSSKVRQISNRLLSPLEQGMAKASCLLYTSPSPRDRQKSRMPSSA